MLTIANEQNLKPRTTLSKEEAMKLGSKGGKASVESRRKKKLMAEQIELLLSLPLKDEKARAKLQALGIDTDNIDNQMALVISMWNTAIKGGKSSVQAATFLRDTVGEKPKETIEVSKGIDESIKEIDDYLCQKRKN